MLIKLLRSTFFIVGTAIGAGVLALPIATVSCGFWGSFLALILTWTFMTLAANNMLQARLCFKEEVDLATMSSRMLGAKGKIIIEICYLALLYALVSLYITVGAAWTRELLGAFEIPLSISTSQVIFTATIALLIYSGIAKLSLINKVVTITMLLFMILIISLSIPKVEVSNLMDISLTSIPSTIPMLLTTYGFSIVLPSLATYLSNDRRVLSQSLIAGSLIILIVYLGWELVAFGVIGPQQSGLAGLASSQDQGTEVINALSEIVNEPLFHSVGFSFMVAAVLSSIFGVGYCLFSYLKDTLPIKKQPANSLVAITAGFVTPVLILHLYPLGVSAILGLGGIFVAIILGIVPTLMVLSKYYSQHLKAPSKAQRLISYGIITFFVIAIGIEILNLMS